MLKWIILTSVLLFCLFLQGDAIADQHDLTSACLSAHFPPDYTFSSGEDWCDAYGAQYQIDSQTSINSSIPGDVYVSAANPFTWYILVSFCDGEDKLWGGVSFGLGEYSEDACFITNHGGCVPGGGAGHTSPGWPGSGSGIDLLSTMPWEGNFEPVYYFQGYQYSGTTIIPVTGYFENDIWNPAGVQNTINPITFYSINDDNALGAMGVGVDGEGIECEDLSDVLEAPGSPDMRELDLRIQSPAMEIVEIRYSVPGLNQRPVSLNVFDSSGRFVRSLVDGHQNPGIYRVTWDGFDESGCKAPESVYYFRMTAGVIQKTVNVALIR
jgi:FlgD Ig-like domain